MELPKTEILSQVAVRKKRDEIADTMAKIDEIELESSIETDSISTDSVSL